MDKTKMISIIILVCVALLESIPTHGQLLKRLTKRAAEAAEEALIRKAEDKAIEETEEVFDSLFNRDWKKKSVQNNEVTQDEGMNDEFENEGGDSSNDFYSEDESNASEMTIYQKFDFIPGDRIMLYDDFSSDNIGDFPSKWDSNGSGELVTFSGSDEKWMKMVNQSTYIPDLPDDLPDDFTFEFDVIGLGIDQQTSSVARFKIQMDDGKSFQDGRNRAIVQLPFAQYIDAGIQLSNYLENNRSIYNNIKTDIREHLLNQAHVSVAINRQRFRLWVNEEKVVDVPRLIPKVNITSVKISINGFKDGKESIFINNVKIAKGGLDLRHQLVSEGKFSTSGILFDVNSSTIKPASYPVIKDIASVLKENPELSIKVVGHTDADGDDETNLTLSKKRAYSVKELLVNEFSIEIGRIDIDGKGETEPIDSNTTTTGKANNRRVEFIKI